MLVGERRTSVEGVLVVAMMLSLNCVFEEREVESKCALNVS